MAEAFATSVASNLVSKLGEYLFAPIGRQFGYVLCYKSHVQDLENGVEKLETEKKRVQSSVDEAVYDGKPIHTDVKKWLESVENKAKEARHLLNQGGSAKISCFRGWLPNPMMRHPIGRKVKKMTQVIQELHAESANNNFQKVYRENLPMGILTATTSAMTAFNDKEAVDDKENVVESMAKITEDIMKAIADDKCCVIGVHGPGGVGKSKLLEDVEKRVKKGKMVDVIAVANVSRNPNLKTIQGEIADALGLKLTNMESARGRANRLRERLECDHEKKILIILDNLWKKLELKDVGIPCDDDNKVRGCKLLLSSRHRDVLRRDMGINREFRLNELNHEEARRLFEKTVEDKANDPDFKAMVDGVVRNCGGLPLLILSVAKRLKYGSSAEWRNALTNMDLSDAKSIVELNYNDLEDDRIKSVFLISALQSGNIFVRYTLSYCMGLGLYKKFKTIDDARDRLIMDLHRLQDSSLLLDGDDMEEFRMHDIFVDMAISIASTQWHALAGREDYGFKDWSKDELSKCTAMSFSFVGIDELPEKLECPNLRMLLLYEDNPSLKIPELFFESTKKLQVLDFTHLSFNSLPSSIGCLENLNSLRLDYCHMEDVTILGKLKGLQFLSFEGSVITKLSKEIGELTELRFLDLTGCDELKIIEPGVLGSLVNLEELYMEDSFDQWEAEDEAPQSNASLAELKKMKKLRTLYIAIPYSTYLPRDLPFGKLSKHKIQIGDIWDWSGDYIESRSLKVKLDSDNLLLEESMTKCLEKAQDLHLDGLQDGIDSIHNLCIGGFQELKHIHVQNSSSFKYVVRSIESIHCTAFTRLKSLFLNNLSNLEKISRGGLALESFSRLKIVKVDNCGKIKHLFPLSMKRIISQLEEIEISRCHSIQEVLTDAKVDEDGDERDDDTKVISCNLRRLTLQNLPEMISFCKSANHSVNFFDEQQVSLPWLESLTLSKLPKLKEIWNSQFPLDVSNLRFLNIEDCTFLLSIFPSNLVAKLQNLEAIAIKRCRLIQEVFDLEGLTANGDVEILSRLSTLTLSNLPRLGHIWNRNPRRASCFRNLRKLKVQNCDNMRFLFSFSLAKVLGQIKEIEIASCKLMKEIIDVEGEESEEATSIDTLEFPLLTSLSLKELPKLKTFFYGSIHCPTLERLLIYRCPKMMTFSSFKGKRQSMIADAGLQQAFGRINSSLTLPAFFDKKVVFPKLEELRLKGIQSSGLWENEMANDSICQLKVLEVKQCPNLLNVIPSFMWKRLLHYMESLIVEGCPRLRNLFTVSMTKSLVQLQYLIIGGCKEMEYIVAREEEEPEDVANVIVIPQLVTLHLRKMRKLRSFCHGKHISKWPSLKKFIVEDCKAVEVILEDASRTKLEGSIATQQPLLLVEKVDFPSMEWMKISHMDNVKKIWPNELASNAFTTLESLVVEYCKKLSSLFSSHAVLTRFQNLKEITMIHCQSLEVVFHNQEFNFGEACSTRTFELRKLVLSRLPKMKHVWSGPPCETLTFERLRCLEVEECESLKSLFPVSIAKSLTQLEKLYIRDCGVEEIIMDEDKVEMRAGDLFFPQLTDLRLLELSELRSFYKNIHTSTWPLLKQLRVRHCDKMRSFSFACESQSCQGTSSSENQPALFSFEEVIPRLEGVILSREDVEVAMMQHHSIFGNLKKLELTCYHDENVAFPSNFLLQSFPSLEELVVICSSFEEIFLEDASGLGGATPCGGLTDVDEALQALGNLERLELFNLCNLRRVWTNGSLMAEILKRIKYLLVQLCPSLSIVFPCPISFQRLEQLEIEDCAGLVHMGTCSAVASFVHLTSLTLRNCGAMEDVVTYDGNGAEEISFPVLEELTLDSLWSLECFSPTNCGFMFPALVQIVVTHCPKMKTFCKGALRTPNLDKVLLSDRDDEWRWEGDLDTTIQTLSTRNHPRRIQ